MPKTKKSNGLNAYYDLEVSYPCFDFICFLTYAEWTRRRLGISELGVVFVPTRESYVDEEFDFGAQRNQWLFNNVLLRCCSLLPSCKTVEVCGSRQEARDIFDRGDKSVFPDGYTVDNPIDGWSPTWITALGNMGEDIQYLQSSSQAQIYIEEWRKANAQDNRLVTLTLRNAEHNSERNYNPDVWGAFAQTLKDDGFFPVVVPDTETALMDLPPQFDGVARLPVVAFNVDLRVALYEASYLNVFGLNGTAALAAFNKRVRFIQIKNPDFIGDVNGIEKFMGHRYGGCLPHLNDYQRMIWVEPTLEVFKSEFRAMSDLIDSRIAEETYEAGLGPNPDLREPMIDLARRFYRHENWPQFDFTANWMLEKEPDNAELQYLIGRAELVRQKGGAETESRVRLAYERCVDLIESSLPTNLDPETFKYWTVSLIYLGRGEEAIEKFEQLLNSDVPNLDAYFLSLGTAFEENNLPENADEVYRMSLRADIVSDSICRQCCQFYSQLGQIGEVIKNFEKLVDRFSVDAEEIERWGLIFEERDQPADAAQLYRSAVDKGVNSPEIVYRLGIALKRLEQFGDAAIAFEWLHDQGCQGDWIYRELSEVYLALGRLEEAKSLLNSADVTISNGETSLKPD